MCWTTTILSNMRTIFKQTSTPTFRRPTIRFGEFVGEVLECSEAKSTQMHLQSQRFYALGLNCIEIHTISIYEHTTELDTAQRKMASAYNRNVCEPIRNFAHSNQTIRTHPFISPVCIIQGITFNSEHAHTRAHINWCGVFRKPSARDTARAESKRQTQTYV